MKKNREGDADTEYSEEEGEIAESGKNVDHIVWDYGQNCVQIYTCYTDDSDSRGNQRAYSDAPLGIRAAEGKKIYESYDGSD